VHFGDAREDAQHCVRIADIDDEKHNWLLAFSS
jgi:hypothetical protein